ncbi:MAG: histidine triad nucleotide-binding protein [Thermoflexales bacterium]|nr:histidine triad nucleotide-binding protein [Thermoflexales bacterium]
MAEDTIFAKIARGEVPARIVYQDNDVTAFYDVAPAAPKHVLIIPNKPIRTLNDATEADRRVLGQMLLVARQVAADLGVAESGYRLVMNCNRDGGQSVWHLHLHLLAGRTLSWPPG